MQIEERGILDFMHLKALVCALVQLKVHGVLSKLVRGESMWDCWGHILCDKAKEGSELLNVFGWEHGQNVFDFLQIWFDSYWRQWSCKHQFEQASQVC